MTSEERFEAHEQWLLDHDRAVKKHDEDITRIHAMLDRTREEHDENIAEIHAILQEIARVMARLVDREEGKN